MCATGSTSDISSKENIQETAVTLMGMVLGLYATDYIDGSLFGTWACFIVLMIVHVWANYRGVKCLVLRTLNRQRLTALAEDFIDNDIAYTQAVETVCGAKLSLKKAASVPVSSSSQQHGQGHNVLTPAEVSKRESIWYRNKLNSLIELGVPFHDMIAKR